MNDKAQQALQQYREKVANGEVAPSEHKTLKEKQEQKPTLRTSVDYMYFQCIYGEDVIKQVRCHYENGNGIPLNMKDKNIKKIRDRSTDSTALYLYKYETTAPCLVDKCRRDAVAKWLSGEEMGV